MSRDITDPRVVGILAAFNRFMASETRGADYLDIFMHKLLGTGSDQSLFADWSDGAARAVVLAYALNCPDERLADLDSYLDARLDWIASGRDAWIAGGRDAWARHTLAVLKAAEVKRKPRAKRKKNPAHRSRKARAA